MSNEEVIDLLDKATILVDYLSKRTSCTCDVMDKMIDWTIYVHGVIHKIAQGEKC